MNFYEVDGPEKLRDKYTTLVKVLFCTV